MKHPEPWMLLGGCRYRPDLPWIEDPARVGLGQEASMSVVCTRCLVRASCIDFVARADIRSGFWAGDFRDPPDTAMGGVA